MDETTRSNAVKGAPVVVLVAALCLLFTAPQSSAARTDLPNPCQLVPTKLIDSALGLKKSPPTMLSTITNVSTCSYKNLLTIAVGYTALTNPVPPKTITKVAGLPKGIYETFSGSNQTELTFFLGSSSSGLYVVIRNFAKIPEKKLVKIALALHKALGGTTTSAPGGTLIPQSP